MGRLAVLVAVMLWPVVAHGSVLRQPARRRRVGERGRPARAAGAGRGWLVRLVREPRPRAGLRGRRSGDGGVALIGAGSRASMPPLRATSLLVVTAVCLAFCAPARATGESAADAAQARDHFAQGSRLYDLSEYEKALA